MKALPGTDSCSRKRVTFLVSLFSLFWIAGTSHAFDVTLAWEANTEPNIIAYIVYYDTSSNGFYDLEIDDYVEQYSVDGGRTWSSGADIFPIWLPAGVTRITLRLPSKDKDYFFAVGAFDSAWRASALSREIAVIAPARIAAPYNRGWAITRGDLEGFKVFYNNEMDAVVPTLGSPEEIPAFNLSGLRGLGVPLNLQPSGAVFNQPVWIEFPAPGYSNMNQLSLGLYDDSRWRLVWDGAEGALTAAGEGWLDGEPEYNRDEDPHTVSIVVKHFTGVQAAAPPGSTVTVSGSGGGGCFIAAMGRRQRRSGTYRGRPL